MTAKHLGRYEIIETLGRGSMGVVYKAHDPLIERTVAIKTISYAGLTPAEARDFEQRFFFEAKSAGRLSHPNIVTIHDVGQAEDLAYIAMEFLPGQSLRTILDSGVVLSTRQIAKVAHHVASGLAFAHAHGVVHRDIKPANIMVPESGQVKITDFGIALLPSGSMTMSGTAFGSPKYMSPEQVLGHKADRRSDIFSLGVVLYEMLTGAPPFTGADLNAILYQVLNSVPPLPSDINASLPPAFDRIVARALAKDPDKRYQSAEEMAADLRNYKKLPGLMHTSTAPADDAHAEADEVEDTPLPPMQPASAIGKRSMFGWEQIQRAGVLAAALTGLTVLAASTYLWLRPVPPAEAAPVSVASSAKSVHTPTASKQSATPVVVASASTEPAKATAPEKHAANNKPKPRKKDDSIKLAQADTSPAAPEEHKPLPMDWRAKLNADYAACEHLSFFSRVACRERAVWKHCPGHWGTSDLCPQAAQ